MDRINTFLTSLIMDYKYVIIGGGIAGLTAAIRLAELGASPLVIEASTYPSHKVCGEFFSPECVTILKRWGVNPVEISSALFYDNQRELFFPFSSPAGSVSHITCDPLLKDLAIQKKVQVLSNTKVVTLNPGSPFHQLELSTGERIRASHLIVATGRLPQDNTPVPMRYLGIKAHFSGFPSNNTLKMFIFKNGYLGISPIENGLFNVAGLIDLKHTHCTADINQTISTLFSNNPLLKKFMDGGICLFNDWMTVKIPEFGVKQTPSWPNCYFIGDAAGTIPPITGQGLSMGMRGGLMAAAFAVKHDVEGFKKAWRQKFASPIYWGKRLHFLSLNRFSSSVIMRLGGTLPSLTQHVYRLTRKE